MKINKFCLILLTVVLSGCALYGPQYNKPKINVESGWSSQYPLTIVESGTDLSYKAWWGKFNDSQLNTLIESALISNNNIQMAIGNIVQAQGYLQQIKMGWVPVVGGQAVYSSSRLIGNSNNDMNSTGLSNNYGLGLVPSYSLNIFQQLRSQEAADASLMSAIYTKNATRLSIIGQVVGGYFTLVAQDYLLVLQKELVEDLNQRLELGKSQYKLGYISLVTLQDYEQQYYVAKAQIPVIQNNIVQSQNTLRVLTNQNPGNVKRKDNFDDIKIDQVVPINLPSEVLKNRPDIMQAEEQLKQANANIGVATSLFFPTISLTSPIGLSSNQLGDLFSGSTNFWQTQLQATMPFLNLSYLGQIKGAKGAYYNAYYNYINAVRVAFKQIDDSLSAHARLADSYDLQKSQFNSAKLAYSLGNQRYRDGADSYLTMLSYKIVLDNAGISLADLKLQQLQAIVTLYQNLAGGYNIGNTNEPKKFGDSHDA